MRVMSDQHLRANALADLHWLARRDVVPLDLRLARPAQHRVGGELGGVVADDRLRRAPLGHQIGQLTHDTTDGDRAIDHRPQAPARNVVDDVEHPEPAPRDKPVMDEVQALALVGERQHRCRRPRADGAPSYVPRQA